MPGQGWIAALAVVTVRAEPLPPEEWLAGQLARARASFAEWSPEAHEMLVAPEAAALAGRPAIHVRYRLLGGGPEDEAPAPDAGPVPASFVEHWTVLVEERSWLLAMELMVQPPERWEQERDELELPFRLTRASLTSARRRRHRRAPGRPPSGGRSAAGDQAV